MINLFYRFTVKMRKDRVRAHAAEAAFFTIMSFFPVLMMLLALVQFTPLKQEQVMVALEKVTPFEVTKLLEPMVGSVYTYSSGLVPWTAVLALWSGGKSMMGVADGLNSIYRIEETKNYIITRIRAACYTVVMILALILSLGILVFGYWILDYLQVVVPLLSHFSDTLMIWPMLLAMVILILLFSILYVYLPNRRQLWKEQIPGAIFSAVSWAAFSYAFSIYLELAVNMSVLYGSLTTLVVVMLWLYVCMYLLFIGAEINHYLMRPELFN